MWYLPHHPVFNPKKPDKTRIVFDCAAKYKEISLNDNVLQGPDLTNKLVGILLIFRQDRVAFIADIEGMFNQVLVEENDRDALRFLWWDNGDLTKEPRTHRMKSHLFGGVWSPSAANYAIKRAADDNKNDFSLDAVETVKKNFYVDDCLKSVPRDGTWIVELSSDVCGLLERAGFRLTKMISNSRALMKAMPHTELVKEAKDLDLDSDVLPTERALGLIWDVDKDQFKPSIAVNDRPLTRRGVLSILSSVYDPLGLVSPFVLEARMIFEDLCRAKLTWDEEMPREHLERWSRWREDLPRLANFSVPPCLRSDELGTVIHSQLHHFADASQGGLGATSYLRQEDVNGRVHCSLVMSKAKLAPLKTTTIPRLELTAAIEAVKLDKLLRSELEIQISESVFWTDSMIVLFYIKNESKRYQTFVANRVAKIHESTVSTQWRHEPTDQNPADDVIQGYDS
ncbi:uncharacterized protein LOC135496114 [Lineus longissimus]|uniref:uncharacterized protein LOC135496114 n=1 Tax=Lineus longissimus TaxID=88925 RepID=UPI00315CFC66